MRDDIVETSLVQLNNFPNTKEPITTESFMNYRYVYARGLISINEENDVGAELIANGDMTVTLSKFVAATKRHSEFNNFIVCYKETGTVLKIPISSVTTDTYYAVCISYTTDLSVNTKSLNKTIVGYENGSPVVDFQVLDETCYIYIKEGINSEFEPVRDSNYYELITHIIKVPKNSEIILQENITNVTMNPIFCGRALDLREYGKDIKSNSTENFEGVSMLPSRSDHVHKGTAQDFGTDIKSVSEENYGGTSNLLSRSDHVHKISDEIKIAEWKKYIENRMPVGTIFASYDDTIESKKWDYDNPYAYSPIINLSKINTTAFELKEENFPDLYPKLKNFSIERLSINNIVLSTGYVKFFVNRNSDSQKILELIANDLIFDTYFSDYSRNRKTITLQQSVATIVQGDREITEINLIEGSISVFRIGNETNNLYKICDLYYYPFRIYISNYAMLNNIADVGIPQISSSIFIGTNNKGYSTEHIAISLRGSTVKTGRTPEEAPENLEIFTNGVQYYMHAGRYL